MIIAATNPGDPIANGFIFWTAVLAVTFMWAIGRFIHKSETGKRITKWRDRQDW